MADNPLILSLDAGTTSVRCIVFDAKGEVRHVAQKPFMQYYPNPGWVEQRPEELLEAQLEVLGQALEAAGRLSGSVACAGITNQRETTIVWDKKTGEPVYNAIVWQCRRTAPYIEKLAALGLIEAIHTRTGLVPDAYFSATKLAWILDNVEGARERAKAGELLFGTVDTWLIWNLTGGRVHATDPTNASRTMLYNIHELKWDDELLGLFDIPKEMLPEVRPSSGDFGTIELEGYGQDIPITGVAGDQQSALFGQCCFEPGQAKSTYGTGCFLLMNIGDKPRLSDSGLLTTVAASPDGKPCYALEGSAFVCGQLIGWLVDLGLLDDPANSSDVAMSVEDTGGVYVVPAFAGLGTPYWDQDAHGAIYGLTRGTQPAHIVRAGLEGLAFQVYDILSEMENDAGTRLQQLNVDGGASLNDFLMQFQADVLGVTIERPASPEATALGAAYLAGLATGVWGGIDDLASLQGAATVYKPQVGTNQVTQLIEGWKDAIARTITRK
ncbi:MAG: glycerol kinase GlpK [Coriobacteriales bacterium]|jgi:glycerol kinase